MKKALLIINPVSGKMKAKSIVFDVIDTLDKNGYETTVRITAHKGHATQIARQGAKKYSLIVCCGGDGTVNEVVAGCMISNAETPIGYIPTGSTNDFASSLGLSVKPVDAINNIIKFPVRSLDVGLFNTERYFNYIASFGLFTSSSYSVPQSTKNTLGYLAYVLEALKDIANVKPYRITVNADGEIFEDEYIFGAVANSTSVGGIMRLKADYVDMRDGLFEILLIKNPRSIADFHKLLVSVSASDFENEMFTFLHAKQITFNMEEAIPWSLDGEFQEGSQCVTIKNIASAINFAGQNSNLIK
ncbi:MAG: diacylglycerol kinase family lipid kinase [Clostridia bacterium]|nr:diacylglycerol kinase family lipid kinase [Clostridia bacterium]